MSPHNSSTVRAALYDGICDVPDFPKAGIVFKDITPLLGDGDLFARAVEGMALPFDGAGVTRVIAIESRGFVLGGAVARVLGAGVVPIRKPGKLPRRAHRVDYRLEYGTDALEMHGDAVVTDERVLVVDDVLATGGTARAAADLVRQAGARLVGFSFLIELLDLGGRARLPEGRIEVLLPYPRVR